MKAAPRNPKPTVAFDGATYSLRSRKTVVPELSAMTRIEALLWLCQNTTPRGYHKAPNPLAGFGAISVRILTPDQFGRQAVYAYCGSCDQEHSFGTVYPDGDIEVQFPEEFNMDRQSAIAAIREQLR